MPMSGARVRFQATAVDGSTVEDKAPDFTNEGPRSEESKQEAEPASDYVTGRTHARMPNC